MGQVITTAEIKRVVDSNVRAYTEQVTSQFSRLFGRSPTFVTYYSQDLAQSGADINLGGTIDIIGPESPIKFRAVYDFPIYGVTEADLSSAYDEVLGTVSGNVGGEAHVLPGTLEPAENDIFIIQHLETKLVFRVKQADPDRIEGKAYFKLQYFLDVIDPVDIERQLSGEYAFEMANLGTEFSPIIEQETSLLLREMEAIQEQHRQLYWKAFYDRGSGTLIQRQNFAKAVHDRSLDMFVRRNDLLSSGRYLGSRTVVPPEYSDRGGFEATVYPFTIYWMAEKSEWDEDVFDSVTLAAAKPRSPSSPFYADFAIDGYFEAMPVSGGEVMHGGEGFVEKVTSKVFGVADRPLTALAGKVLSGYFREGDMRERLKEFTQALNSTALQRDWSAYFWLLPIVLLQAKRFREQGQQTTN